MFKCKECKLLQEEVTYLRQENAKLLDRVVALADAKAYHAVVSPSAPDGECYGGDDDSIYSYNEFGERITIKRNERTV